MFEKLQQIYQSLGTAHKMLNAKGVGVDHRIIKRYTWASKKVSWGGGHKINALQITKYALLNFWTTLMTSLSRIWSPQLGEFPPINNDSLSPTGNLFLSIASDFCRCFVSLASLKDFQQTLNSEPEQ